MTLNRIIQSLLLAALILSIIERTHRRKDERALQGDADPVRAHDALRLTNL